MQRRQKGDEDPNPCPPDYCPGYNPWAVSFHCGECGTEVFVWYRCESCQSGTGRGVATADHATSAKIGSRYYDFLCLCCEKKLTEASLQQEVAE